MFEEPVYIYHYVNNKKNFITPSVEFAIKRADGEVLVEEKGKGIVKKILVS